ncbi:uncharacterized protein [Epargyreus clarus]|uniref:uncharacterized protein n=1 Tax=Epargyreus clarus TaxID=520877 RepID=UPI003C2F59F7
MMKLVVLCCAFAVATAISPIYISPFGAYPYAAPFPYAAPLVQPYNYRGPLSLAPGQPAEILGADGRPLDTLEVNQDRAAHFAAKTGLHLIKKRAANLLPYSSYAASYATPYNARVSYVSPYIPTYNAPIIRAY